MDTVRIEYRLNGTTSSDERSADRITVQLWDSGRALIRMHYGGRATGVLFYRRAERIEWVRKDSES